MGEGWVRVKAPMTTTAFRLKPTTTVGFVADQGGRGFHLPTDFAIRSDGKVFVASRSNTTALDIVGIQMASIDHEFFGQIGGYGRAAGQMIWPSALALDSDDNLYMADDMLQRITVYDRDGNVTGTWGTQGTADGEFDGVSGLVFDADDNLLLVDHRNNRVQKFTRDGRFISKWGSAGTGDGELDLPWGISLDRHGFVYLADWRNDRIQKFTSDGEFVAKFGSSGNGDGEFDRPSGLAIDSDGNMYIADWGNQRVQVLDSGGRFLQKLRGDAVLGAWAVEYLNANADELEARSKYVPVFEVDVTDPNEVSARIETYFWDPVRVALDDQERVYVLETGRHRFQVYQKA